MADERAGEKVAQWAAVLAAWMVAQMVPSSVDQMAALMAAPMAAQKVAYSAVCSVKKLAVYWADDSVARTAGTSVDRWAEQRAVRLVVRSVVQMAASMAG